MADDRYEAYRAMNRRNKVSIILKSKFYAILRYTRRKS